MHAEVVMESGSERIYTVAQIIAYSFCRWTNPNLQIIMRPCFTAVAKVKQLQMFGFLGSFIDWTPLRKHFWQITSQHFEQAIFHLRSLLLRAMMQLRKQIFI